MTIANLKALKKISKKLMKGRSVNAINVEPAVSSALCLQKINLSQEKKWF